MLFKSGISAIVVGFMLLYGQAVFPALAQEDPVPQEAVLDTSILPETVSQAVLQHLSQQLGVEISNLHITRFDYATPGWIVILTDDKDTYVYHTDDFGYNVQLEPISQD